MDILIDMPIYEPALNKLRQIPELRIKCLHPIPKRDELQVEDIDLFEILFCTHLPEFYHQMTNLKFIQISSSGYAQLIGKNIIERNIKACNALGIFDCPIAEWNMAMMVNLSRDFRTLNQNQNHKIWDRSARFQSEIRGSVLGIWGYGGIGRETARLAKAFGQQVYVMTKNGVSKRENTYHVSETGDPEGLLPDKEFTLTNTENFLKSLDFLVLAMPHNKDTEGIIGVEELKSLKSSAFLLNPARGPLIVEQALLKGLREGWIAGAALDTHYCYPMPVDHPLWEMPNVIMTPHISGSDKGPYFLERIWDLFVQNVLRFSKGEQLLNELSPVQLIG